MEELMKNRLEKIREKISIEKKVTVSDLSKLYKVTEETIRRDLDKLEAEGFLTRSFGGAVLNNSSQKENVQFYKRASINREEKKKIAVLAYDILSTKRAIATDASTTVMEAAKLMKDHEMIILSASTEIFTQLSDTNGRIISTGGTFNYKTLSLQGSVAKNTVKRYHVDLALISCKGLSIEKGVLDSNESEAEIKKAMLAQAQEVALLADYSKFGQSAFVRLIGLDQVNYLVTDRKPEEEWIAYCTEHEVKLIY